jgi:hypothetical protein
MCDKKTNSIVHAQQAPVERVAEFMTTAEKELVAFYEAVFRRYGLKEAKKAAQDWIEELETMDWPADWALPNWRHVTIAAADCLAPQNHRPFSGPMRATDLPSDWTQFHTGRCRGRFSRPPQRRTTTCTAFRTEKSRSTGTRSKRFLPALTGKIPPANSESAVPIGFVYYPSSRGPADARSAGF